MGSQDTHPKGAVCVLGPLSAWKTENDGHSSLSRISCPQTLTPSGESWSNRDQAPRTPLLPSNPVDHAWKRKRRTKLNDAGSNAGNYGKISWRLVKCFQIECSRIIKILRAFIRRDRLLQKSSRRKGAIKRYDRNLDCFRSFSCRNYKLFLRVPRIREILSLVRQEKRLSSEQIQWME